MWIHVGLPSIARFIISKCECIGIGKIEFSSRYFNWIITLYFFLFLINWSAIYFSIKSIENLLPFAGRVWPIGKRNQEIKTIGMRCKCAVRWDTCFDAKLHNNKVIMHSRWGFSLRKMQIYINMINILRFAISFPFPSFCDAVECGSQAQSDCVFLFVSIETCLLFNYRHWKWHFATAWKTVDTAHWFCVLIKRCCAHLTTQSISQMGRTIEPIERIVQQPVMVCTCDKFVKWHSI